MPLIPNIPIEKVHKYPFAYVILILGGFIGVLATNLTSKDRQVIKAKDEQINQLIIQNQAEKVETQFWKNKYLGVTDYNAYYVRRQDSLNRIALQKPIIALDQAIKNKNKK